MQDAAHSTFGDAVCLCLGRGDGVSSDTEHFLRYRLSFPCKAKDCCSRQRSAENEEWIDAGRQHSRCMHSSCVFGPSGQLLLDTSWEARPPHVQHHVTSTRTKTAKTWHRQVSTYLIQVGLGPAASLPLFLSSHYPHWLQNTMQALLLTFCR